MFDLQREWEQLLQLFGIAQAQAEPVFAGLSQAYSSSGRVYHTLAHIQSVLEWIDRLRSHATDVPAIQLAAWFHDCVYDPRADDNEEQSALSARNTLTNLALPDATIQTVARMILATKTHRVDEALTDCQILLDADLAILGSSASQYDAYAEAIHREYHWVPTSVYKSARSQVLQTFLQRARIYQTEPMYITLEKAARANLHREIAALS